MGRQPQDQRHRRRAWRFALRRLAWSVLTLLVATLTIFSMLELSPGDAASRVAGPEASAELVAEVRANLRLDDPFPERYWAWLSGVVTGDFGESLLTDEPVADLIGRSLPRTLSILAVATVVALVVALAAATLSAVRRGRAEDHLVLAATSLALAVPPFWLGLILVNLLAVRYRWFPSGGYADFGAGPGQWLRHLVLPAVTVGAVLAAEITRQLRGSLGDALRTDYVLSARMRGLSRSRVVGKHALKNAAVPVVTTLGVRLAQLLGGIVIVERVFAINGLGSLMANAVHARDIPVVMGVVVVFAAMVMVINLVVDSTYAYFDPRQR